MDAADQRPQPRPDGGWPTGHPERYWLAHVGVGAAQNRRVCARGHGSRVALRLCRPDGDLAITSLTELHTRLGLAPVTDGFNVAIAAASSGLSARTTSVVNPRSFLFSPLRPLARDQLVVVAFSRGDQLVEIAAYDAARKEIDFYLGAYDLTCDGSTCRAAEQLGPASEHGWRNFTLYADDDLVDTPLDCQSCHQPDGPGTPRRLLMRDHPDPWFHWLPRPDETSVPCPEGQRAIKTPPDLRGEFARLFPDGHAALGPGAAGTALGHNLHSLINLFEIDLGLPPRPPVMDAEAVVREWRCEGARRSWLDYRARMLEAQGFPIPHHDFDVLDPVHAHAARTDRAGFLAANADADPFVLLAGLLSDDAQRATGALVDADGRTGAALLRQACVRCHDGRAPAGSGRARFDPRQLTPASAQAARERLALPDDSPFLMPPRRSSTLTPAARAVIRQHLESAQP